MILLSIKIICGVILSYLVGSIPTAYVFGKWAKGIDIRKHGSGNVGATNTFRVLGKWPGILVLVVDILKGVLATTVIGDLLGLNEMIYRVAFGVMSVIGHNWTVFLQFKGGKGIATSLGVLIGLTIKIAAIRPILLLTIITWLAVFALSGFVSLSSIVASVLLPVWMIVLTQSFELIFLGILFCIFVILRHRTNIKRLLSGTESRVFVPFKKRRKSS